MTTYKPQWNQMQVLILYKKLILALLALKQLIREANILTLKFYQSNSYAALSKVPPCIVSAIDIRN